MSALVLVWLSSLMLSAAAIVVMIALILMRIARRRRALSEQKTKAALTRELLRAANGETTTLSARRLSQRECGILARSTVELLELVDGETAFRIAHALTDCGIPDVLVRWMGSANASRRVAAAETLAFFADRAGRAALTEALKDRNQDVRLAAATSLIKLRAAPALGVLVKVLSAHGAPSARLRQILDLICAQHPAEVLHLAHDASLSSFVRSKAIDAIAAGGDDERAVDLMKLAADSDADIRTAAIRGLGRMMHRRAAPTLAGAFGDPAWFVRAAAAEAAGRIGLYHLVPALTSLVDDPVWWVRFRASEALITLDEVGRAALRRVAAQNRGAGGHAAAMALAEWAKAS